MSWTIWECAILTLLIPAAYILVALMLFDKFQIKRNKPTIFNWTNKKEEEDVDDKKCRFSENN